MTITYPIGDCDTASFELDPGEMPGTSDHLILALADWLWVNFGQELDCDAVLISLVWVQGAEEARQGPRKAPESQAD